MGRQFLSGSDKSILKLIVMLVAQLYECGKNNIELLKKKRKAKVNV